MLLAGGTVVVPEIAQQGDARLTLIDIGSIAPLQTFIQADGYLQIGATVSLARIASSPEAQPRYTALAQAAATVGNPNVRSAATIGGNVAFRRPVADLPPALLALGAEVLLYGLDGLESRPVLQVITDGVPAARLITAVRIPHGSGQRSAFLKFAWRQASGQTIVNVAVALCVVGGLIAGPRLAIGGLCRATRVLAAEQALEGRPWSDDLMEEVARIAAAQVTCDVVGPPSEAYRRRLVMAGVRRILADVAKS
jgi:CO/xanthine dehydrogenase FAD-binding subunit